MCVNILAMCDVLTFLPWDRNEPTIIFGGSPSGAIRMQLDCKAALQQSVLVHRCILESEHLFVCLLGREVHVFLSQMDCQGDSERKKASFYSSFIIILQNIV